MTVHKLLFGDGAARYLPLALSRLRALEALNPEGFFSQTVIVDDATVNVRQAGSQQYVTITMGGGFYFEFCTSGFPVKVIDSGIPSFPNKYSSLTVGAGITAVGGSIVAKPRVLQDKRGYTSQVGYTPQIQLINESPKYRQLDAKARARYYYPDIIYSSFAPPSGANGVGLRTASMRRSNFGQYPYTGEELAKRQRDLSYDQTWAYGQKFQNPPLNATLVDNADWPRESGYQTVTDDKYGTRSFAITIDTFGRFHVHPISAIGAIIGTGVQNVTATEIRHVSPVMPSWAYVPTMMGKDYIAANPNLTQWLIDQPDYDWKFNHTGTKACAVIYGRSPYTNDTAYWATDAHPDTPWTQAKFDDMVQRYVNENSARIYQQEDPTHNPQMYFVGAGIVECTVKITLTGVESNQFSVEVTATTIRDPNTTPYSALFAGYVWKDITAVDVSAGDLVCVDIEAYNHPIKNRAGPFFVMSVKNLTKNKEAFATVAYQIVAVDLSTLSFVLRLTSPLEVITSTPLRAGGVDNVGWNVDRFALWVIHSGLSKALLFPESMQTPWKDELTALAVCNGRQYINDIKALYGNIEYIPLAHPKDGWGDATWNSYREFWALDRHYWYLETWVWTDPDVWFHGTGYPTEGYVEYRTTPGGYTPPALSLAYEVLGMTMPYNNTSEHLMFCDNPRWGWNYYAGAAAFFDGTEAQTTFFAHPNGSFCLYADHFIYNAQGVPNWATTWGEPVFYANTLSMVDTTQYEHCIFDRVHLEVRKQAGTAAVLETSFMDLYNQAVQKGRKEGTLEADIKEMTRADIRGTFAKVVNSTTTDTQGFPIETLDLKFTWRTKNWFFHEPGVQGAYLSGEPAILFPPAWLGTLAGATLGMYWGEDQAYSSLQAPLFVNLSNPTALPIRFCNPLIIMG